jgi:hypothetical protein
MHARAWRVRQVGRDSRSVLRPSAATWGPVRGVAPEALADGGTPMTEQARGGLCGLGSAFWTGHLIRTTVHHNWTGVDNGASSDLPARWIRVQGVVASIWGPSCHFRRLLARIWESIRTEPVISMTSSSRLLKLCPRKGKARRDGSSRTNPPY